MATNEKPTLVHNFLPEHYKKENAPKINHNYLRDQFSDYPKIFEKIKTLIENGDFTLGKAVDEFEAKICGLTRSKYTVGVGNGTDAIFLSLKALGVGPGDEVITTPYTFFATVGAIVTAGAKPVFVDVGEDYNLDPSKIEAALTPRSKAILPVHWAGLPCNMDLICKIAKKHSLYVVEDACHSLLGRQGDQFTGTFGELGCFSLHPLKNLNVWGDGGFIVTNSKELHDKLVLLRNHGLVNRDHCVMYAYNSRLDTLQAIVANHLIDEKLEHLTENRIRNAKLFDELLSSIPQITVPKRDPQKKHVYHLYIVRAQTRNELQQYLVANDVDAKIHYPIPLHLQPASAPYGYKRGDFPVVERLCEEVISFPVHEYITKDQIHTVVEKVRNFYQ